MTPDQLVGTLGVLTPAAVVGLNLVFAYSYTENMRGPLRARVRWAYLSRVPNSLSALALGFSFLALMSEGLQGSATLFRISLLFTSLILLNYTIHIENKPRPTRRSDAVKLVATLAAAVLLTTFPAAMLLRLL